ncbi:Hypothetical protein FBFL15_0107 [Flavobacterium branchiophilum FL-15]|uniref:Uncharacterized protein n=1 Tax=Flavobacterium branchiophilum (strain FL-15) TaxID=1034807 RepID=G2Z3T0_FLABF|nr:Hypothetical protein FBFL15_0107 [Flavobacterium branchiophilum FL-15]
MIFVSCSKEKNKEINFHAFYSENGKANSNNRKINSYILFSKNTVGQICLIKSNDIFYTYKKNKIKDKYEVFFNNVLSQKTLMEIDSLDYICFKVDNNIESDFINLKKNIILNKYTVKSSNDKSYIIKNKLKNNEILSVAYTLFKSGYAVTYNDYLGVYYVKELMIVTDD